MGAVLEEEQRQCRMLVFLPHQSCAGGRWRLSPTSPCNSSFPSLPSLFSFRVGNSGRQQGSDVQAVPAVGAGGAGGEDPGHHQGESCLLRQVLLRSPRAPGRRCLLCTHRLVHSFPFSSWSSPVSNISIFSKLIFHTSGK